MGTRVDTVVSDNHRRLRHGKQYLNSATASVHTVMDVTTPPTVSIKAGTLECCFIVGASFLHDITELLSLTFDKLALQKFEDGI